MRTQDWRLPAITILAGVLLATLAILLAWWSKVLLKEASKAECATRAGALALRVQQELEQRLRTAVRDGAHPAEVLAVYHLRRGEVVRRDPPDAADPAPVVLRAAGLHDATSDLPIVLPGHAATFVPSRADPRGNGQLVVWDLDAVRARIVVPHLQRDDRYASALIETEADVAKLGFRVRAAQTLYPPLSDWRVAVGLTDPGEIRRNLRWQTTLLGLLAGWLLLVLAGSVWLRARRDRQRVERQQTKERFLARAYHELQTPLALMRAAAESVQRGAIHRPEDLDRCVAIMAREEERLTRTIRRLLRYLRLESTPEATGELASLVEETSRTVEEARPALEAHGLAVELTPDGLDPALQAPRELVADTLHELFANVRKYATGATKVAVELRPDGGERAVLAVSDDGPGVPEPEAAFTPWEQKEEGARGGSGLGLALLREGWEAVGGAIRCEAAPGGGARFVVTVPLQR